MVAWYHGIPKKGTALKILPSGYHFHAVEDTYAELPVVIQEATNFVLACYGYPENLDACFEWKFSGFCY